MYRRLDRCRRACDPDFRLFPGDGQGPAWLHTRERPGAGRRMHIRDEPFPLIDAVGAVAGVATALTSSDGDAVRFGAVAGGALGFSSYTGFRRVGGVPGSG